MQSKYTVFDRRYLKCQPLQARESDLQPENIKELLTPTNPFSAGDWLPFIEAVIAARRASRPVILMMGGHPIKLGLSRYIIDLMKNGWITHLAGNGATAVHDFELAHGSGTSENVERYIKDGQFGMWEDTGTLNMVADYAWINNLGLGEALGWWIDTQKSHPQYSIYRAAYEYNVPATVHVGIGADITHAHETCNGCAWGGASYRDFLIFANTISQLEGGVFINLGTAVTGPEVYLKALSMARNVATQRHETIANFTTAVFDLVQLPSTFRDGPPDKDSPGYYYRPWKTILYRTVQDGGFSYYFCGDHRDTLPTLWATLSRGS
jgi:hypothetical protein